MVRMIGLYDCVNTRKAELPITLPGSENRSTYGVGLHSKSAYALLEKDVRVPTVGARTSNSTQCD